MDVSQRKIKNSQGVRLNRYKEAVRPGKVIFYIYIYIYISFDLATNPPAVTARQSAKH